MGIFPTAPRPPELDAETIKNQTDIVAVIGQRVTLKPSGREFEGLCPFHNEKTPSFKVDPKKRAWNCFGCGTGGSVIDFVMKIDGLTLDQACRSLAGLDAAPRRSTATPPRKQADPWRVAMPVPNSAPPPFGGAFWARRVLPGLNWELTILAVP
ncbi:MAG: hypothetical protein HQL94_10220, partial [Magnetococcales bacterium]|nr:hypothetical protein [Magnetococcales bacterium]